MISRMASAASVAASGSASAAVRPSILRLRFLAYAGKIRAICLSLAMAVSIGAMRIHLPIQFHMHVKE